MKRLFFIFIFMVNFLYAASEVIIDNQDSGFSTSGTWSESGASDEYEGSSVFSKILNSSATWTPTLPEAGLYDVYVWYTGSTYNRDTDASYTVNYAGGSETIGIDQNQGSGDWVLLGTFTFNAGISGNVILLRDAETGGTSADAVRFVSQGPDTTPPALAEVTPVPTPTNDSTPSYTFSSSEAGTITYGGSCGSAATTATAGNNTVTFATLADGTYSDCTIIVTDAATNVSSSLAVTEFVVDETAPPVNLAPVVDAGLEQTITLPEGASLEGTVTDDGLPVPYTVEWTQVSGPGTATFANAGEEDTTVSFSQAGTYVLLLTADDTELQNSADVEITVNPAGSSSGIIIDNQDSGFSTSGTWSESGASDEYEGSSVFSKILNSSATWTPTLPEAGLYDVYVWYTGSTYNRDTDASYTVNYAGGSETIGIDQNQGSGDWVLLGTFTFNAGISGNVILLRDAETGGTSADAVRFVSQGPDTTPPALAEVTPVPTPTNDSTPSYTFSSSEAGTITYGGSCGSAATTATAGNNTVTFATLADGTYSDCTIIVTDAATNVSSSLAVTEFVVDETADITLPVIMILGNNPLSLQLEDTFSDPGATAHDNVDGDLTSFIQTSDDVDTSAVGTYSVTYTVSDTAGNTATEVRTVVVYDGDFQVIELNELEANTPRTEDDFGYDVDISGEYAVVSARLLDVGGVSDVGAAYVYKKDTNGHYTRIAELHAEDGAEGDYFGTSVAINGDYVVVGAMGEDSDNSSASFDCGALYVFKKDVLDNYTQIAKLVADDGASYDHLGWVLDMSGDYIVAGADNSMSFAGSVYVFKNDGLDNYTQVDKLTASDATPGDYFGYSVAISGGYVAVGAFYEEPDSVINAGSAYIFKKDAGADTFSEVSKINADDLEENDHFGRSVDIDGEYVVVGAIREDPYGVENAGSAYVFKNDGADHFDQITKLIADDAEIGDLFGLSVAIDGMYIVVGAIREDTGGISNAGSAYVFQNIGDDYFLQVAKVYASDAMAGDYFGKSVSISGINIAVGANSALPTSGADAGSAYVYTILP